MDREIKFRGKCVPDSRYAGEWVTGGYAAPEADCKKQDEGLIIFYFGGNSTFTCHVIPETVGQFTGLRDKSGREIYEGDIVVRHEIAFGRDSLGAVRYDLDKAMFVLFCKKVYGIYRFPLVRFESFKDGKCTISETYEYEVVGNVYDNPELLDNVSRK